MRLPRSPLQARCLQTGVSLLLASQCFLGALPGFAEPVALTGAPAAVEQLTSTSQSAPAAAAPAPGSASQSALQGLMTLEQARQLSALQDMGSIPSDEKVALRKVSVANSQVPATHSPRACHAYLPCASLHLLCVCTRPVLPHVPTLAFCSQLKDKGALKILKSGQDYAERGADPETQMLDPAVLRQAEGRLPNPNPVLNPNPDPKPKPKPQP